MEWELTQGGFRPAWSSTILSANLALSILRILEHYAVVDALSESPAASADSALQTDVLQRSDEASSELSPYRLQLERRNDDDGDYYAVSRLIAINNGLHQKLASVQLQNDDLQKKLKSCSELLAEQESLKINFDILKVKQKEHEAEMKRQSAENAALKIKISELTAALESSVREREKAIEDLSKGVSPSSSRAVEAPAASLKTAEAPSVIQSTDGAYLDDFAARIDEDWEKAKAENKHRKFVELIAAERTQMTLSNRRSFCGTLKELSVGAYSSEAHFAQELLQNADDTTFDSSTTPTVRIFFGDESKGKRSIPFTHNEMGMSARDVLAICSTGCSQKIAGKQTGQKGLGFKSVFACSNEPLLISGQWSFQFHFDPKIHDELAFLTPIWVDTEKLPPDFATDFRSPAAEDQHKTIVHLPLRDGVFRLYFPSRPNN